MERELKEMLGAKEGALSCTDELAPIFCKPKLIPLKSITIEKLEKMQREALGRIKKNDDTRMSNDAVYREANDGNSGKEGVGKSRTEIWCSDEKNEKNLILQLPKK